jgi:hypothetical protein
MRLLLLSAMFFFGTLMTAGLLALGAPQPAAHMARTVQPVLVAGDAAGHGAAARAAR